MVFSPWMLLTLIFVALLHVTTATPNLEAKIKNRFQIVVDDGRFPNYTVTLDGSMSTAADRYTWNEVEKPENARRTKFTARHSAITNITIHHEAGMYKFQLRASSRLVNRKREHSDAYSKVYVEKPSSVGMYLFASDVIKYLLEMHYQYIALSQHHQSASSYHPRVEEYFRNLARNREKMLDEVMEHVLEKQATEDMINSCPTDYVAVMMSKGFVKKLSVNYNATDINGMKSAFKIVQGSETELAKKLSIVVHHARRNQDYELAVFVSTGLLPQVTKTLKNVKSHLETTLNHYETASPERHLVEFLFDKHLKVEI